MIDGWSLGAASGLNFRGGVVGQDGVVGWHRGGHEDGARDRGSRADDRVSAQDGCSGIDGDIVFDSGVTPFAAPGLPALG